MLVCEYFDRKTGRGGASQRLEDPGRAQGRGERERERERDVVAISLLPTRAGLRRALFRYENWGTYRRSLPRVILMVVQPVVEHLLDDGLDVRAPEPLVLTVPASFPEGRGGGKRSATVLAENSSKRATLRCRPALKTHPSGLVMKVFS